MRSTEACYVNRTYVEALGFELPATLTWDFIWEVSEAALAAKQLEAEGIDARVINIHTIKPIDKDIIIKAAAETGLIVTVEEHSVIGGLGSAVADVVTENKPVPVVKIGVNDQYGYSGPAVDLLKEFGLCADNIAATVKDAMAKK